MNDYLETFIEVNEVVTHILQFGLKKPITEQNKVDEPILVLMVSGNPGEVEYYKDFMAQINTEINMPVVGVSHAGHSVIPNNWSNPSIDENPDLYSLNGQIVHLKCFIEKYISRNSKLVLIGHSIGCYIILEAIHRYPDIRAKVLHSIFIFPTIESLAETPEGFKYSILFGWFKQPLIWLAYVTNLLSETFKWKIISYFIGSKHANSPECAIKSATNLLNPYCLKALIFMSLIEFKTVNQLNREAFESNEKKLTLLYGETDNWCPVEYYHRIGRLYPNCDIRLCLEDINHAFVLEKESTLKISRMIVPIIESVIQKL